MTEFVNPMPELTEVSRAFYAAARARRLVIQQCSQCQQKIFYPKFICPHCLGSDLEWVECCGRGKPSSLPPPRS